MSQSIAFSDSNIETVQIKASTQGWGSFGKILLWQSKTLDNKAHTQEDWIKVTWNLYRSLWSTNTCLVFIHWIYCPLVVTAPMNRKLRLYVSISLSGALLPTRQYDILLSPDHKFNCIMWTWMCNINTAYIWDNSTYTWNIWLQQYRYCLCVSCNMYLGCLQAKLLLNNPKYILENLEKEILRFY